MQISICLLILLIIVIIIILSIYRSLNDDRFIIIDKTNRDHRYNNMLKRFEKHMRNWYALGNDSFTLDHGERYFKFFERMGNPHMIAHLNSNNNNDEENIDATSCGILRNIKLDDNFRNKKKSIHIGRTRIHRCWYICDLKVDKSARNNWLPYKMMWKMMHLRSLSNKGYCVSMNTIGEENKVVRLSKRISSPLVNFEYSGGILIYSLNYDEICRILPLIERYKGPVFFVSLLGIKDIILKSTQKPMKLLHMNLFKNIDNAVIDELLLPQEDFTHMFCFHERDPIVKVLAEENIHTDTTASLIHCGMNSLKPIDWDFIQTSEI